MFGNMKILELKLKLHFSDEIDEIETEIIGRNVLNAVYQHINTAGIVPDFSDAFTEKVELIINNEYIDEINL